MNPEPSQLSPPSGVLPEKGPPAVRGILETTLYVADVCRARDWYRDVLGLRECSLEPPRHVFFRLSNSMLLIFNSKESSKIGGDVPPHGASGAVHLAFATQHDELGRWRRHLKSQGVAVEKEISWPGGARSIYFRDPDGNSLELATRDLWKF